jgi:hypothetical protein
MRSSQQWLPRSIECLRGYTTRQFTQDLIAGFTVGLVALPLAMAFAIASGVPPQAGLYTAVVAGFLISALGGSRTQIGGPTGAFVVIVAGIVVKFGLGGLALVGIMAGILLLMMGITGLVLPTASHCSSHPLRSRIFSARKPQPFPVNSWRGSGCCSTMSEPHDGRPLLSP